MGKYHPHIDGLRAIAVMAVIAYHLDSGLLPGGYIGVDIFFVISGFLITGIIRREIEAGSFSFRVFYARRVRRIIPALIVVIAATLTAGYFLMLPPDFGTLADSARWASLGAANFYFWSEAGYFAPAAERLPLLHTWSLGVEEQFYLVWPLLMVLSLPLLRRIRVPEVMLVATLIIASLGYAIYVLPLDQNEPFYSPLTRAWELGLGAALVFAPTLSNRVVGNALNALGLAAIGLALSGGSLIHLILACLGAVLILLPTSSPSIASRVLALPPLVFTGKISYSLYLWHWPILVLYGHYYLLEQTSPASTAIYLGAVAVVSILSWRFVELPFRSWRPPPIQPIAATVAASAVLILAGTLALDGWPWRISEHGLHYLDAKHFRNNSGNPRGSNCFIDSGDDRDSKTFTPDLCLSIMPGKPNVLLIGDSHANQFIGALRKVYPEINFSMAAASGCYSLLDDYGTRRCVDGAKAIYDNYLEAYGFDAVIISARWREGRRLNLISPSVQRILDAHSRAYILGPNLEYEMEVPQMLAYQELRGVDVATSLEVVEEARRAEHSILATLGDLRPIYYSTLDIMCPKGICSATTPSDEPMLQDENHLSEPGALRVTARLRKKGLMSDLLSAPAP